MTSPRTFAGAGALARASSSLKIACSISVAPRPPYSFGHDRPAQPPSWSWPCQRRRHSKPSPSSSGGLPGWFASSHARNSSRKASSLGLSVRSMRPPSSLSRGLDPLDQRAGAETAATAHRHEADLLVGALELVQERRDQPRPGGAERMAEGDRTAVDVHAVHVRLELAPPGRDHGGERLVDLDQ